MLRVPSYRARMETSSPNAKPTDVTAPLDDAPAFWFRLFNEIGIINQLSTTQLEASLPKGLKAADFRLLNHFMRLGGPRTPVALAQSFQVTKGTMTHTLQKMSGLGLVTLAPNGGDGRSKLVDITEAGRQAHAQALRNLLPSMEGALGNFDAAVMADLQTALPALAKLREALDKARD